MNKTENRKDEFDLALENMKLEREIATELGISEVAVYKHLAQVYLFLRNLDFFVNFAGKVQYNTLLDMKIQEVMKLQRKSLISINMNRRFLDIGG